MQAKPKLSDLIRKAEKRALQDRPSDEAEEIGEPTPVAATPAAVRTIAEKADVPPPVVMESRYLRARLFVAEYLASGFDLLHAWKASHPKTKAKPSSYRSCAERYLKTDAVQAVWREERERFITDMDVSDTWVMERWRQQANANVFDYLLQDEDGYVRARSDIEALPPEIQMNIREIQVNRRTVKRDEDEEIYDDNIKFKLVDPQKSLELIARALRMFEPRKEDDQDAASRARRMRQALERAQAAGYSGRTIDQDGNPA